MEKQVLKRKLSPVFRWLFWVLLVQFILINISAAFYADKLSRLNAADEIPSATSSNNIFTKTWRLFTGPRQFKSVIADYPSFAFDTVLLKTDKGIYIEGWYSQTDSVSKGTVLLFHGVTLNKGRVLAEAAEFRFLGYDVLLIDFRAHGNSGSKTTTIGVREAEEVKLAYDYATQKGEKNIYIWGSSMGAVAVARALANYELKPAGIILEMPFASLQSHLRARARALGFQGLPEKPFGFLVTCWMGWENGFNGLKHSTVSYAKKINVPVLLQYGMRDTYVRQEETNNVFAAIASSNKKLVGFETAAHESLLQNDQLKWETEVKQFLLTNSQ